MADSGVPTAAPAGEQCLKEAAAGRPRACLSSNTSCQALHASSKLMYLEDITSRNQRKVLLSACSQSGSMVQCCQ